MDWILLSGFGTTALLWIDLRDFIRDRWPRQSAHSAPLAPAAQSAPAPGAWQPVHGFAAQNSRVNSRRPALNDVSVARWQYRGAATADGADERGWQSAARRLAGQWTALDGVISHHDAYVHGAAAATEGAKRRTLSPDQILSARINAAYAVWAAARSSQLYGE